MNKDIEKSMHGLMEIIGRCSCWDDMLFFGVLVEQSEESWDWTDLADSAKSHRERHVESAKSVSVSYTHLTLPTKA